MYQPVPQALPRFLDGLLWVLALAEALVEAEEPQVGALALLLIRLLVQGVQLALLEGACQECRAILGVPEGILDQVLREAVVV